MELIFPLCQIQNYHSVSKDIHITVFFTQTRMHTKDMIHNFRDTEEWLKLDMEIDRCRWKVAREHAEEVVRDMS